MVFYERALHGGGIGVLTLSPGATAADAGKRPIYDVLRREIVTLRLRPGERLSENELASRFGTSRAPVREALIRLVEDGLIEVRPQRGSFVSRLSLRAMERARFVREALEVAIIRRAAEQGISDKAREQLEQAIAAQKKAAGDPDLFTRRDDQFHRGLAEAAGLSSVWDVIEREKAQFDRLRYLSLPASTPVDLLIRQHLTILSATLSRKPAAAEKAVRVHMREVLRIAADLASAHQELFAFDT